MTLTDLNESVSEGFEWKYDYIDYYLDYFMLAFERTLFKN